MHMFEMSPNISAKISVCLSEIEHFQLSGCWNIAFFHLRISYFLMKYDTAQRYTLLAH